MPHEARKYLWDVFDAASFLIEDNNIYEASAQNSTEDPDNASSRARPPQSFKGLSKALDPSPGPTSDT